MIQSQTSWSTWGIGVCDSLGTTTENPPAYVREEPEDENRLAMILVWGLRSDTHALPHQVASPFHILYCIMEHIMSMHGPRSQPYVGIHLLTPAFGLIAVEEGTPFA